MRWACLQGNKADASWPCTIHLGAWDVSAWFPQEAHTDMKISIMKFIWRILVIICRRKGKKAGLGRGRNWDLIVSRKRQLTPAGSSEVMVARQSGHNLWLGEPSFPYSYWPVIECRYNPGGGSFSQLSMISGEDSALSTGGWLHSPLVVFWGGYGTKGLRVWRGIWVCITEPTPLAAACSLKIICSCSK